MASLVMERSNRISFEQDESFEDYTKAVLGDASRLIDQEVNPSFPTHYPGLPASGMRTVSKMITQAEAEGEKLTGRYSKMISLIRRDSRIPGPEYAIECSFPPDNEGLQETVLYEWDSRFARQRLVRTITDMRNRQSRYELLHQDPHHDFGRQAILQIKQLVNDYVNQSVTDDRIGQEPNG